MSDAIKSMISQAAQEAENLASEANKVREAAQVEPKQVEASTDDDVNGWPPEAAAELAAQEEGSSDPHNSEGALRDRIVEAIKSIYDPEIPVNIYDLGLIYEVQIDPSRNINVVMTLTSPHCPVAESMPAEVEARVRLVPGTADVSVELTWEPAWNPDSMSDEAKLELGMF